MIATQVLRLPVRARLVSEEEMQRLRERQERVREEQKPKMGWVDAPEEERVA